MPKFAKRILIALAAAAGLAGVLVFAAGIYVESGLSQERLEKELSRALHMPVRAGRISVSPLGSVSVSGVTAPQPAPGAPGNFIETGAFTARFQWLPLLKRRIVIDDVVLSQPRLAWFQNDSGKWRLPEPARQPAPAPAETPVVEKAAQPAKAKPAPVVEIAVNSLRFTDGTFDFYDHDGNIVASFTGVEALSSSPTLAAVSGTASIARLAIRERVFVDNVTTPFVYQPDGLDLSKIAATVAGGKLDGKFHIELQEPGSPITTTAQFENVDLSRLLADAHLPADRASGKLNGSIEVAGKAGDEKTLKGKAAFNCAGGQVRNYEFFQSLAQVFGIDELARLDLRRASAENTIDRGRILVDSLVLETPNVLLTAKGKVKFNGKLDLDARLVLGEKVARQLPEFIDSKFSPGEAAGSRQIDFDVGGTVEKPKSNLLERLVGKSLENQAASLLKSIFGSARKEQKKQDNNETPPQPSPQPTPQPTSAPTPASTPDAGANNPAPPTQP